MKYLEAETVSDLKAAFSPYEIEIGTTPDGALQSGSTEIKDASFPSKLNVSFRISTTRLDGGVLRNCSVEIFGESEDFNKFAAFVQQRAAELLGDEYSVKGGYIVSKNGLKDAALNISVPGFPPEKSLSVLQTRRFRTVSLHSATAE